MKRICTTLLLLLTVFVLADAKPAKVKLPQGMLRLTSYDRDGKELATSVGFFISADGVGVSTYAPFKNAYSAKVVDAKGKTWNVTRIFGANDLFDVVKFRTDCTSATALTVAETAVASGDAISLMPPTGKAIGGTVTDVKAYEGLNYLTLSIAPDSTLVGFPVLNAKGEAVGIVQSSATRDAKTSPAVDIDVVRRLAITAMSAGDLALNNIHIARQLPEDAGQAQTYLYLISRNNPDTTIYLTGLNDFVATFPDQSVGYVDRAAYYVERKRFAEAEADYEKAFEVSKDPADAHYAFSKLLYQLNIQKAYQPYKDWTLERALTAASKAQELSPNPIYQLQEGNCLFGLKRYEEAYNKYQAVNAVEATPQSLFYAARARECWDDDSTTVLRLLDQAMASYPKPYTPQAAPFLLQRAQHRVKYALYRLAAIDLSDYEALVGTNRLDHGFFYEKAQVDMEAKIYSWAIDDIDKALRLRPEEYDYLVEKAMIHLRLASLDEAAFAAEKAIKVNADGADAYKVLGIIYGEKGEKAKALEYLKKAKSLGDTQVDEWIEKLQ